MTAITDIKTLIKDLRSAIIQQLQLDGKYVLNAIQLKGPIMHQQITAGEQLFKSFSQSDTVVIFELLEDDDDDTVDAESKTQAFVYMPYRMHVMIYGDESSVQAKKLRARLMTEEIRCALHSKGINLIDCSKTEGMPEIINDCIWQRRDFYINISCYMLVDKIIQDYDYNTTDFNVIVV